MVYICTLTHMSRTNVEIDDELIAQVMQRYGFRTMREAIHESLRRMVGYTMTVEEALAMQGQGWDGDLSAMRDGRKVEEW